MTMEFEGLKQEQKPQEEEILGINKRLEATKQQPEQIMAVL